MSEMRFTKDHEWIRVEGTSAIVGITDYAQKQLGDIVFVELPALGRVVEQGGEVCVVESVKAASEIYAPVGGTVTEVNTRLEEEPALVNESAEDRAWFFRLDLADPAEVAGLMDRAAYDAYVSSLD